MLQVVLNDNRQLLNYLQGRENDSDQSADPTNFLQRSLVISICLRAAAETKEKLRCLRESISCFRQCSRHCQRLLSMVRTLKPGVVRQVATMMLMSTANFIQGFEVRLRDSLLDIIARLYSRLSDYRNAEKYPVSAASVFLKRDQKLDLRINDFLHHHVNRHNRRDHTTRRFVRSIHCMRLPPTKVKEEVSAILPRE